MRLPLCILRPNSNFALSSRIGRDGLSPGGGLRLIGLWRRSQLKPPDLSVEFDICPTVTEDLASRSTKKSRGILGADWGFKGLACRRGPRGRMTQL